jgi:universal stress protein A
VEPASVSDHDVSGGVIRRILVGFDGSNGAQRALHVARSLSSDLHGEVHVLVVVRPPAHAETSEAREQAVEAERRNLSQGLENQRGGDLRELVPAPHFVVDNDPPAAISRYAKEFGFDLIVVGTHGREHMTHRGVGHSLEVLLRHHPCPLLVI